LFAWIVRIVTNAGGAVTVNPIELVAVRSCESATATASVNVPADAGVKLYEKIPSPAVTSPFVPSSYIGCVEDPPADVRFTCTVIPVLAGEVAAVTVAVSNVAFPVNTAAGVALAVAESDTAPVHAASVVDVLRGKGPPEILKSVLLFAVTEHDGVRIAAVVFVNAAVGLLNEQFAAPKPIRSTSAGSEVGQAPVSAVVLLTSATLPVVALILIEPVASAVGRFIVPPVPAAS
jgi:hypothetical protein